MSSAFSPSKVPQKKTKVVETPSAKRARLKKEKQEEKDKKREDVVKRLEEEIQAAEKAKAEEVKKVSNDKLSNGHSCDSSHALESAILSELQKSDDCISLFLLSLSDGLRALPQATFRQFQMEVLQLLIKYESGVPPSSVEQENPKLKLSVDQFVSTLKPCFIMLTKRGP